MAFIPDGAIDRMTELSAGAWRLYCFLARCRNQKTGKCFPSVKVTAEAINVHSKNIFKLRKELVKAGWARFDGDQASNLFGFESSKNATTSVDIVEDTDVSSKNATIGADLNVCNADGSKNATPESQKRYPMVAKTLPDGSKNATRIKEEPAKEPAKEPEREREGETQVDAIAAALCDLYRIPDTGGWQLRDKFQRLAIELHGIEATLLDVRSFYVSRQRKPGVEFFLGDFVAWRASQNGSAPKPKNPAAQVGKNKPTVEEPMAEEMDEYVETAIAANDLIYLARLRDEIIKRGAVHEWERKVLTFFETPIAGEEIATKAEMAELNRRIADLHPVTRLRAG